MVIEISDATKEQVLELFTQLENKVTIHIFIEDHECLYCGDTSELVKQVAELSDKIEVIEHKDGLETPIAKDLGVRFHPATVIQGEKPYKVRFYGIPAGHEFSALVGSIIDASTGQPDLPADIIEDIKSVDKPVHIQVFTTPQCPYCPNMVRLTHQAAILNPLIESDMIEALEFQELSKKYQVYGVPKTVINETVSVEGLTPPELFVEKLFEAVD